MISTKKEIDDMIIDISYEYTCDRLIHIYKTYHKQSTDSIFYKDIQLILHGKILDGNDNIHDIVRYARTYSSSNTVKIYVLEDRDTSNNTQDMSIVEKECIKIVECNQMYALLSSYVQSILCSYDTNNYADHINILLVNMPLMDSKILDIINMCSKYYHTSHSNPFEDYYVHLIFDILGIKPHSKYTNINHTRIPHNDNRINNVNDQANNNNNNNNGNVNNGNNNNGNNNGNGNNNMNGNIDDGMVQRMGMNMMNVIRGNIMRIVISTIFLISLLVYSNSYSIIYILIGILVIQKIMEPLDLLQNININNDVRRAIDNNVDNPIFRGIKYYILSFCEFFVCLVLSISPQWNIDVYIKSVYHYLFKQYILDNIRINEERLMHQDRNGENGDVVREDGNDTENRNNGGLIREDGNDRDVVREDGNNGDDRDVEDSGNDRDAGDSGDDRDIIEE